MSLALLEFAAVDVEPEHEAMLASRPPSVYKAKVRLVFVEKDSL